jgi:squalene-hopene/tetraprenyl-beta-curcumene cyclase
MKTWTAGIVTCSACLAASLLAARPQNGASSSPAWNARAAAAYLDSRQEWWLGWPNAARDHNTACVSCHTALPYALARPALRAELREADLPTPERKLLDNVVTRVRLWKEVEPFYPDQTRGLPKTSESRGTEAVLNALILATRDAQSGTFASDTQQAFDNFWALQFTAGDMKGAWAWLNFHNEPWEASGSPYFGAALAAVAIGTAPGDYATRADIQDRTKSLRDYLRRGIESESLFNRLMALWACGKLPGLLEAGPRQAIVDAAFGKQQEDGGWTTSALAPWKRQDGTALDITSDGFATGVITFVLQQAGTPRTEPHVRKGLAWLVQHQQPTTGMWTAASVNKQRDPSTDVGKFMSDAATAYAVLALTERR